MKPTNNDRSLHSDSNADSTDDQGSNENLDQLIRINELREQAREAGGGEMEDWTADDCPLDLQEAFWESVLAWENAPDTTFRALVESQDVRPPDPKTLSEQTVREPLKEVVEALAQLHVYLSHTDHLSDLELYTRLVDDLLLQPTKQAPNGEAWHCELDMLGGCSREDLRLLQKYYSDEWCYGDWDEAALGPAPEPELPPYDRDHWLPKDPNRPC